MITVPVLESYSREKKDDYRCSLSIDFHLQTGEAKLPISIRRE